MPRKKKDPAFLAYPGDFLSDPKAAALDNMMLGAYWRLIMYCWIDGSLPTDKTDLRALSRAKTTHEWLRIEREVVPLFKMSQKFKPQPRLIHKRLEEERRKLRAKSKIRSEAAHKRWDASASRLHMQNVCTLSSSSSSSSKEDKGPKRTFQKRSKQASWRIHEVIGEKLTSYGASGKHEHAGLYHMMAQYLPEPTIMAALARVNDKIMEAMAGGSKPNDLHRYFIGVVRSICTEEKIESPINWNGEKK